MIRRGLYRLDDIAAFVTDRVSTKDYIYAGIYFFPNKFPPKSIVHGKVAPAIYELEKEVTKVKDARGTRELEGVSQVMNSSWVA